MLSVVLVLVLVLVLVVSIEASPAALFVDPPPVDVVSPPLPLAFPVLDARTSC